MLRTTTQSSLMLIVALVVVSALLLVACGDSRGKFTPTSTPLAGAEGRSVTYTYDAAGRLIQADYGDGASIK